MPSRADPAPAPGEEQRRVGCTLIEFGGVGVLTDPFWSHLPVGQVLFGEVVPDPDQIEPMLPPTLDHVQAVYSAGAVDFLVVPFHPEVLEEKVAKHIAEARAKKQQAEQAAAS